MGTEPIGYALLISDRKARLRAYWSWVVNIDTTKPALQRVMEALLLTHSRITDTHMIGDRCGRGYSADLAVQIPEGEEAKFKAIAKPYLMNAPPRVQVGMDVPPDDGHPGRER